VVSWNCNGSVVGGRNVEGAAVEKIIIELGAIVYILTVCAQADQLGLKRLT